MKAFQASEVRNRLISLAADPVTTTPAEFGAYIKAEIARWAKVVRDSGAKAE